MVRWQKTYDWDFLKINSRYSYHVEDWGNRYTAPGRPDDAAGPGPRGASGSADDFRHLDRLDALGRDGRPARVLSEHLGAVADLRKALGPEVPLVMTIFTPMSIAMDLAGGPQDLAALIALDPSMVHVGLRTITDTFAGFARQVLEAGADGIFLAATHTATLTNFTPEQYAEFGRPVRPGGPAWRPSGAPFNCLHVCKPRVAGERTGRLPRGPAQLGHRRPDEPAPGRSWPTRPARPCWAGWTGNSCSGKARSRPCWPRPARSSRR